MRELGRKPLAKQVLDLQGQSQQHIACLAGAGRVGRRQDALDLAVGDGRDDGGHHDGNWYARRAQSLDGFEPARWRCRSRLHLAGNRAVEGGDRHGHLDEIAPRHPRENIDVARHQRRFRDDTDRMIGAVEDLEHRACDAVLTLDRLVWVRDGAERDVLGDVAWMRQLALQELGGVHLGVELGLKIEPRRVTKEAMRRPSVAIDAAVLAATVGIDGLLKTDVGTVVARDDALCRLSVHIRLERLELAEALPAVIEGLTLLALKTPDPVRTGATSAAPLHLDEVAVRLAASTRSRPFLVNHSVLSLGHGSLGRPSVLAPRK